MKRPASKRPKPARSQAKAPAAPARSSRRFAQTGKDGDTERRILEAARRVFVSRGTAGARMQEIAAEAGVNQALLHYYFRTKDTLARAVFREAAARVFPPLLQILGSDAPIEERIERIVHHYIDVLREHPFLPGYVLSELTFDPQNIPVVMQEVMGAERVAAARAIMQKLDRELAARADAGDFRPMRADQFLVNMGSLGVFPFAARPMFAHLLGMDDPAWERFLKTRRAELPRFILNAMRP